jgi:dimethylargininase
VPAMQHDDVNSGFPSQAYGGQTMTGKLHRVMMRRPVPPASRADWQTFGYYEPVDHRRALVEHAGLVELLRQEGVEVVLDEDEPGSLDAIFSFDPSMVTDEGAILLRMGKAGRESEAAAHARTYAGLGIPVYGEIVSPGQVEGGDVMWIDESSLAIGRGYRTNAEGIEQLRILMKPLGVTVHAFDLPHWNGPGECLHLLSLLSPVAPELAVVYKPLMAVGLVAELEGRGWALLDIPDEEFESQGTNVLGIEPYRAILANGNPGTRAILEDAGCTVLEYVGDEITHNRSGGPTCLTRPILRSSPPVP